MCNAVRTRVRISTAELLHFGHAELSEAASKGRPGSIAFFTFASSRADHQAGERVEPRLCGFLSGSETTVPVSPTQLLAFAAI